MSGNHEKLPARNRQPGQQCASTARRGKCELPDHPGETAEGTRAALEAAMGDPRVRVTLIPRDTPLASSAPLDPRIVRPAEKLVAKYFPGVALVPVMATGSSDGPYREAIGIPVYGVPGVWAALDFNGVHGLNEYISVRSLFVGRDLMTDLVKIYANSN